MKNILLFKIIFKLFVSRAGREIIQEIGIQYNTEGIRFNLNLYNIIKILHYSMLGTDLPFD